MEDNPYKPSTIQELEPLHKKVTFGGRVCLITYSCSTGGITSILLYFVLIILVGTFMGDYIFIAVIILGVGGAIGGLGCSRYLGQVLAVTVAACIYTRFFSKFSDFDWEILQEEWVLHVVFVLIGACTARGSRNRLEKEQRAPSQLQFINLWGISLGLLIFTGLIAWEPDWLFFGSIGVRIITVVGVVWLGYFIGRISYLLLKFIFLTKSMRNGRIW